MSISRASIIVAILLGQVALNVALAADPVYVYTMPPALVAERDDLRRTLDDYPAHEAMWSAQKYSVLYYTVSQKTSGLLVPDPCEGLPIQVQIANGKLLKATYGASGGKCVAGSPAKTKGLYLTPSELFARIRQARAQLECYTPGPKGGCFPTALRITYDSSVRRQANLTP